MKHRRVSAREETARGDRKRRPQETARGDRKRGDRRRPPEETQLQDMINEVDADGNVL